MLCGWLLVGALGAVQQEPAQVGYEALVEGLIDMRWMCEAPREGERSLALDAVASDEPVELAQQGGPGVVGRVWCSRRDGVLRAWVDGAAAPALEWRLADFAAVPRDETLPASPLAGPLGLGWYSVVPISFAHSIRLGFTPDGGGEARLQADLRLLGAGVAVEAFGAQTLELHQRVLRRVARVIADDEHPAAARPNKTVAEAKQLQPDKISPATPYYDGTFYFPLRGSGMLRWWSIQLRDVDDPAARDAILRALTVRVETGTDLDSEAGRECFEIPLGDLFGADGARDPYGNYLTGMRADGTFVWRLPMPYEKHLKFSFRYPTRPAAKFILEFGADGMPPEAVPPMRLRGGWILADAHDDGAFRCELPGPARLVSAFWSSESSSDAPWQDAPAFAFAAGLAQPQPGAWSQVVRRDGPGRFGRFAMLRQYAHDAPVAAAGQSVSFAPPARYSGAAGESRAALRVLWYGSAESAGRFGSQYTPEQRARLPLAPPTFFALPGAFEAESMSLSAVSAQAQVTIEDWSAQQPPASRKEVLVFRPAAAGDQFAFAVSAPIAGEYELIARIGSGPGLGGAAAFLDGRRIGEIATGADDARAIREVVLHRGTFLPRPYVFALRALDAAPVVLDCVFLRPVAQ
jgi:hypothetical protein